MIFRFCVSVCLLFSFVVHAEESSHGLDDAFASVEPKVIAWRRDIHQHPELGNREFRTAAKVSDHLKALGFDDVKTGVAHTGVVGTLRGGSPGPTIALRADMDGLPVEEQTGLPFASKVRAEYNGKEVGVMHACGHDTHVAILMGAAEVLANNRDKLSGTVKFFFQPAEEGAPAGEEGGAKLMIKEGVLDGDDAPEAIFGLHAWPVRAGTINYHSGSFLAAADTMHITVIGRQTHGSSPWRGTDPIFVAGQIMMAIQAIPSRQLDITKGPVVITIGSIHGGVRHNIIPDKVEMTGTIRTFDAGERESLLAKLRRTVDLVAEAGGATATVTIDPYAPVTRNDPVLLQMLMPTLRQAAGEANVVEHPLITGAEDFAHFQARIPGLYLMLGVRHDNLSADEVPANHSPLFDANEDALIVGVRTMVGLALDYAGATAR
uniref:Metal-dependent amidase / aminoacylase n=1 Tax=uncultured marine microorganism TaxID=415540 RepID=A5CFT6_9ZZZZ|nr:metal-dependent amidase / aminoacylase [uncultured marine microorganism]